MDERDFVDGRIAAEDYRTQRQAADARNNGFEAISPTDFFQWADENRSRLEALARSNGASEDDVSSHVDEYLRQLKESQTLGTFDDLNVTLILKNIVRRIENVCTKGEIPVREGVVFGVAPQLGLEAGQLAVMGTGASIITVSMGFPPFCNQLSKAIANTMIHQENYASWDPVAVGQHLQAHPEVVTYWAQVLMHFAMYGWPGSMDSPTLVGLQQITRLQVLEAMELFAVAHEYGHHVMEHGAADSSDATSDLFRDEHEADIFGRMVCLVEGTNSTPLNLYTASGAGAIFMLTALDLVRRTRALLETGSPPAPRNSHPPLEARAEAMEGADMYAPEACRRIYADMRECARAMMETVWSMIEPGVRAMHENGVRPQQDAPDVGGWLPSR